MSLELITRVLMPAMLLFIVFSLGVGLTPADFARIARQPRALLVGVFCHFVLLPLTCLLLIKLFGTGGILAAGFMLVAACPTGTTSNLLTYLARGDVALALSFTAVASVLTIFTLPSIMAWALAHYAGTTQSGPFPVGQITPQIFVLLAVPVGAGMFVRRRWAAWALRFEPVATKISTGLFTLIVVGALFKGWKIFSAHFADLAPLAATLNVCMLALGFLMARLARLDRRQSVTLGIESAIQNPTLAIVVAASLLEDFMLAIPAAVYGVLMYVGGLVFALVMRSRQQPAGS
jgi:BASS family bile acid:Na+ symporter